MESTGEGSVIVSHRGGSGLFPENTLTAFQGTLEYDPDYVELDVHQTKDGVPVVIHDTTVDRTTDGTGPISEMTLDRLQALDAGYRFVEGVGTVGPAKADQSQLDRLQKFYAMADPRFPFRGNGVKIPTLEEVLEKVEARGFLIEVKESYPGLEVAVLDMIEAHGLQDRVIVGSFDVETSGRLRQLMVERWKGDRAFQNFLNRDEAISYYFGRYHLNLLVPRYWGRPDPGGRWLLIPTRHRFLNFHTRRFIRRVHRDGARLLYWTVDDEELMWKLLRRGADGIVSDRPDLLSRVRKEYIEQEAGGSQDAREWV